MKRLRHLIFPLVIVAFTSQAFAAQEVQHADGRVKIGTITESSSTTLTLGQLNDRLAEKAEKAGASAYRIL